MLLAIFSQAHDYVFWLRAYSAWHGFGHNRVGLSGSIRGLPVHAVSLGGYSGQFMCIRVSFIFDQMHIALQLKELPHVCVCVSNPRLIFILAKLLSCSNKLGIDLLCYPDTWIRIWIRDTSIHHFFKKHWYEGTRIYIYRLVQNDHISQYDNIKIVCKW